MLSRRVRTYCDSLEAAILLFSPVLSDFTTFRFRGVRYSTHSIFGQGDPWYFTGVFYWGKTNASGSVSVQVLDIRNGVNVLIKTIGSASCPGEVEQLKLLAQQFSDGQMGQASLGLFASDTDAWFRSIAGNINDSGLLGPELVLGRIFDEIDFHAVPDELFRHLALTRVISPSSKLKTVLYMQEYVHEDRHVQCIYRYMDKLHGKQKQLVWTNSFEHARTIPMSLSEGERSAWVVGYGEHRAAPRS